jgi:membrane protease YdiL (CAAX protease family)
MDARTEAQLDLPGIGFGENGSRGPRRFPVGAGRGLLAIVAAAVGTLLVSMLIGIAFLAAGVDQVEDNHAFLLVATLAQDLIFVGVAYAMTTEGGPVTPGAFGFRRFGRSAIWAMAVAFAAYWVLSLIYGAIVSPPCDKLPDDLGIHESALLAVVAGVFVIGIAPLAEEFFFRGFLFQSLRQSWGVWIAAPVSGLIFGAAHFDLSKLVPLAILGTALALVFHRTRSLWPCILLHALNNTIAFVVLLSGTTC